MSDRRSFWTPPSGWRPHWRSSVGVFDDNVTFDVDELVVKNDDSWLMVIEGEEVWLPRSECTFLDEEMQIEIPRWLAEKEGLVG